jgi:hypothetical protein
MGNFGSRFVLAAFLIAFHSGAFGQAQTRSDAGKSDGPAELPRVYVKSSVADTPAPDKATLVKTPEELRAAIDKASCGDTIRLQAGATFAGQFEFPAKGCDDAHWIVLRTSAPDSELPAEGTRITPCYAGVASLPGRPAFPCSAPKNVMAKVVFDSKGSGPITFAGGASHYRFVGLEITRASAGSVTYNLVIFRKDGTIDHLVFDRVWMHGTAQDETTRGIMLGGSQYVAVVDSYFSDFHCVAVTGACGDSQAIAGGLGDRPMGPYKIVNNFLEAAGENVMFGGGPATQVPADIEIRHNHLFKPLTWKPGSDSFVGGTSGKPFIVKNLFELKNGQRVLFEGNVLENVWGGFTQAGFAILLTPKNPGTCSICMVRDVTIRYSRIAHAGAAMQIGNGLSDYGVAALEGSHNSIHDLVFDDMKYEGCTGCNGDMFQITTTPKAPPPLWLHDVSIRHITVATNRARAGWAIAGPAGQQNMVFQDSIVDGGTAGHVNAGGGAAQCYFGQTVMKGVLDKCWSHYRFDHNVIMNAIPTHKWPPENWPVGGASQVGFVNWKNGVDGDYHLAAKSRFKDQASDERDPGADIDAVNAATRDVQ